MATGTAIEVVMPQMGVSVSEGTITKWLKQPGETIAADEPLLEISTDKVDTEIPSPGSGVVQEILVPEGETVEVGTLLATIAAEGSVAAPPPPPAPAAEPEPSAHEHKEPVPEPEPSPAPRRRSRSPRPGPSSRSPRRRPGTARPSSRRSWRGSQPSTASTPTRSPAPAAAGA